MDTQSRIKAYQRQGKRRVTAKQGRRIVKKAGREPGATVIREGGMGYPASHQGHRVLIGFEGLAPGEAWSL